MFCMEIGLKGQYCKSCATCNVNHGTDSAYFVKSTPRAFRVSFNTLHVYYRHIEDVHEDV